MDPAIHQMMDAVHRYEGTVNQVLGDGVMAPFGAPIAHTDAPCLFKRILSINSRIGSLGEPSRFAVTVLILHSLLFFLPSLTGAGEAGIQPLITERRTAFLAAIEGPWEGQARVTPIGPRPYDLTFMRTAPMRVEGEAHPGRSIHYWTFYEEDETLKLRFLSTFGGNRQPLFLTATAEQDGALIFHAPQPGFLEVYVRPQAQTLTIEIFLRGKPHVEIHLKPRS
jgi:hypothetical protein